MTEACKQNVKLAVHKLPPMPTAVAQLLNVVSDPSSTARDAAKALAGDQALAARILTLVNSAFYGFPGKITTITQAITILGFASVRNLAVALSAMNSISTKQTMKDFKSHALFCGAFAQALALHLRSIQAEEAFLAGLLHDIGQVVMQLIFEEEYLSPMVPEREQQQFGMSHNAAGAETLKSWHLPEVFVQVANNHHNPSDKCMITACVALANSLACCCGFANREKPDPRAAHTKLFAAIHHSGEVGCIFSRAEKAFNSLSGIIGVPDLQKRQQQDKYFGVCSTSPVRAAWIENILKANGIWSKNIHLRDAMNLDLPEGVKLLLLDSHSIEPAVETLSLRLVSKNIRTIIVGETECAELPLFFMPNQLEHIWEENRK